MVDGTTNIIILMVLRWIHFIAGITWIGHLYFFNFVQGNFEKTLDADTKKKVVPQLRPRALWWFRWGAMITMLSGVIYILWEQLAPQNSEQFRGFFTQEKNWWITFGALLGLIMWFNVWFVIWPRQKKILTGISTGNKPADNDQLIAVAGKFSRINTYLSVPMLFGMGGRTHFTGLAEGNFGSFLGWAAGILVVGIAAAWVLIWKVGPSVGTEFAPAASPPAPPPPAAPK